MAYTRRQAEWKNYPDTTTPIRAEDLNAIEGGLVDAAGVADTALGLASTAAASASAATTSANSAVATANQALAAATTPTDPAIANAVNTTSSLTYAALDAYKMAGRAASMVSACAIGAGQWFIKRIGANYQFIRSVGEGRYLVQEFTQVTGLPGSYLVNQLCFTKAAVPMLSVDDNAATYSGTFTHGIASTTTEGYKSRSLAGGSITAASNVLTVTGGDFVAGDVGRRVTIPGAGASGADLQLTITAVTSATQVTLGGSASTTVSGATITVWPGYRYSTVAGATATWTSPSATSLGVRIVTTTVAGLWKVSIDGSTTAANVLPSAQDKVTDGSYPNTILVANGGTLNPTDRVLDCYSTSTQWDVPTAIATDLPFAAHTIVLTATGYTRNGATGNRSYVTGFSYATGVETPTTAGTDMCQTASLNPTFSAFEYAYRFKTTGPTVDFVGSVHGWEKQLTLAFAVDGVPYTLADGETKAVGSNAVVTRQTECYHPDTPSTVTFRVNATYTLDRRGLTVRHVDRWAVAATAYSIYPVMFPQSGYVFDNGQIDASPSAFTMVAGDGSRKGQLNGTTVALWDADGQWSCAVTVPAAKAVTNNYASDTKVYIEDRAPSGSTKLSKVYFTRTGRSSGATDAVAAGDVWAAEATYSWAFLPEGAARAFPA